jgi:S-adenosylmethionine decarboxylase proenzyme
MSLHTGTHLILNVYDIKNTNLLSNLSNIKNKLDKLVKLLNLSVVNEAGYQFEPYGYTYAYILSESHFTIHTYPEKNACFIDIFCCNSSFNSTYAITLIKDLFETDNVNNVVIFR